MAKKKNSNVGITKREATARAKQQMKLYKKALKRSDDLALADEPHMSLKQAYKARKRGQMYQSLKNKGY